MSRPAAERPRDSSLQLDFLAQPRARCHRRSEISYAQHAPRVPGGKRRFPVVCAVALALIGPAAAEADLRPPDRRIVPVAIAERQALVIGNDTYAHLPPLANAVRDARAMRSVLEELGFEVQLVENAGAAALRRAVSQFSGQLASRQVALFYYSGHGLQIRGENFLVPVDFEAANEIDARYASYPAGQALESLEGAGAPLNIMVLDACRDNPFVRSRSGLQGLAIMNAGRGTLIAFATGPGKTASDGLQGSGGLFTHHLIDHLRTPGLSLDEIFNQVTLAVDTDSGGRQTPWVVKSLMGEFYFSESAGGSGGVIERVFWDSVQDSHDAEELRAYLETYPRGRFADLARIRLRGFDHPGAAVPAEAPPACAAAGECTRLGYEHQTRGDDSDLPLAAGYYRLGCDLGAARACTNLGVMYEGGQGVYRDGVKAAELYDRGCEGGDDHGCTFLGFLYQAGRGVPQSPVKAFENFQSGCDGAHSVGCTHLGILYETGVGTGPDFGRARRFYSQGCAGDHAPGCRRLGLMYEKGLGVAADAMIAAELYRLACDGKDAPACTFLGLLHSQGRGVEKNRSIAASLYREGCGYGDESGCQNLRILCRQDAYPFCPPQ